MVGPDVTGTWRAATLPCLPHTNTRCGSIPSSAGNSVDCRRATDRVRTGIPDRDAAHEPPTTARAGTRVTDRHHLRCVRADSGQCQIFVNESHRHRALAYGGRHPVHGASADVASGEHAGRAGLEGLASTSSRTFRSHFLPLQKVFALLDARGQIKWRLTVVQCYWMNASRTRCFGANPLKLNLKASGTPDNLTVRHAKVTAIPVHIVWRRNTPHFEMARKWPFPSCSMEGCK